jgi:hypothetical protein
VEEHRGDSRCGSDGRTMDLGLEDRRKKEETAAARGQGDARRRRGRGEARVQEGRGRALMGRRARDVFICYTWVHSI